MKKHTRKLLKSKNIKVGFFSILLLLSFMLSDPLFAAAAFISIAVHELGHITAAKILKVNFSEFTLSIFGAGLRPDNSLFSYGNEIFMCLCGPFINFLTFVLIFPISMIFNSNFLLYVSLSSLVLGLLNLIPIKDMDGGRILYSVLCLCISSEAAEKTINWISFISILVMWLGSVYVLLIASYGLSSFIFSASLFSKIFLSEYVK